MVLGFKQQFVQPILAGTKLHSIREDNNNRWKAGMMIQMATGTRTRNYKCFHEEECVSTQRIFMSADEGILNITIGFTYQLDDEDKELLATNDGFTDLATFEDFWIPIIEKRELQSFQGKIIHWTPFKYEFD